MHSFHCIMNVNCVAIDKLIFGANFSLSKFAMLTLVERYHVKCILTLNINYQSPMTSITIEFH